MRFHQVKEILEWAVNFHDRLAKRYAELARGSGDERIRMALTYLADHEREMRRGLERYAAEGSAHRNVLDTWFSDLAELPHPEVLERMPVPAALDTTADVLATAVTIHKTLEDMYRHRAEEATIPEEQEFFAALASGHNAEVRRLVRDMGRLDAY